jgi:hypothetical protein
VRLIVIAIVDLAAPELTDLLAATGGQHSSIAEAVSSEVASNLESVSYVDVVAVSPL